MMVIALGMPTSLFIHHNPSEQTWVMPYYARRLRVLHEFSHVKITGEDFDYSYKIACEYFKVPHNDEVRVVPKSDWIRCFYLLTTKHLLYSDSDVYWVNSPALGSDPLKGDLTFGIVWNGNGLPSRVRDWAFAHAKETGMKSCINSNFLIPTKSRLQSDSFIHCKPQDYNSEIKSIISREGSKESK